MTEATARELIAMWRTMADTHERQARRLEADGENSVDPRLCERTLRRCALELESSLRPVAPLIRRRAVPQGDDL